MKTQIWGVEKKPLPYMLGMTDMILHGIDVPTSIRHDNTLLFATGYQLRNSLLANWFGSHGATIW